MRRVDATGRRRDRNAPCFRPQEGRKAQWEDPSLYGETQPLPERPLFLAVASFLGTRPGYVFRTSPAGTGYHLDLPNTDARLRKAGKAAAAAAGLPSVKSGPGPGPGPGAGDASAGGGRKSRFDRDAPGGGGVAGKRRREELDPMDPSSYSDAPVGSWGRGIEASRNYAN